MTRITSVFLCALLTTAWSMPTEAAAQDRLRRRSDRTALSQRPPQRRARPRTTAPRRIMPPVRNDPTSGVRPPRRRATGTTTQQRPDGRALTAQNGRRRSSQAHRGTRRLGGVDNAIRRGKYDSPPLVINNYGIGRRVGRVYTPYRGRNYYGNRLGYGSYAYLLGPGTFAARCGFVPSYHVSCWNGYYRDNYGYPAYTHPRAVYDHYYMGSLRLKVKPRFGEVFVDGYYAGLVNDYDGVFQRLRLEKGPHQIEIRQPGFVTLNFEVLILPGQTVTYEGSLHAAP